MIFKDPEYFSEFLKPVGGNVLIRPAVGTSFYAKINMNRLENIGLFSVSSDSFKAEKEPSDDFFGLTIPLSNSFFVKQNKNIKQYDHPVAHMLLPETPFQMSAKKNAHFLVSTFFLKPIKEYENKLLQSGSSKLASISTDIFLHSYSGAQEGFCSLTLPEHGLFLTMNQQSIQLH